MPHASSNSGRQGPLYGFLDVKNPSNVTRSYWCAFLAGAVIKFNLMILFRTFLNGSRRLTMDQIWSMCPFFVVPVQKIQRDRGIYCDEKDVAHNWQQELLPFRTILMVRVEETGVLKELVFKLVFFMEEVL